MLHGSSEPQLLPCGIIVMEYDIGTSVAQILSEFRPDPLIARMDRESHRHPLRTNLQRRAARIPPNQKDRLNWLLQRRTMIAKLVPEGPKLCYCDLNLNNFILEDGENPDRRMIIIDFEHANFLPHSFLAWEMWNKREFDMEERVRLQSNLEVSRDNIYAIHALSRVLNRQWNLTGHKN
ncbi:hypothetical protein CKAH01_11402 [Colletotrichum kahawae]|uniref:Aminoglycoside phosphotransferase domain-containing protein n=1 Tax=Colletotrichum kahawae TaxID=34407 RepID=A0AAD9YTX6_COLKA|nr:hypothetical protein CKAH01_11402 [Colletotrichum kahawae]